MTMAPSILESSNRRFEVNEMLSGKPSLPAASTFSVSPNANKSAQVTSNDHVEGGADRLTRCRQADGLFHTLLQLVLIQGIAPIVYAP